jgi:tetratricopeptide (TPR) repeat protein
MYIAAINNLSLSLIYSGQINKARELFLEALDIIDEYRLHDTDEAANLYNTLAYTDSDSLLGVSSQDLLGTIAKNNISSLNTILFRINYAFSLLAPDGIDVDIIDKAYALIEECDTALSDFPGNIEEITIHVNKVKALYYLKSGDKEQAREYLNKALTQSDCFMDNGSPELLFNSVITMIAHIPDILGKSELKDLLFRLAASLPERFNYFISQ